MPSLDSMQWKTIRPGAARAMPPVDDLGEAGELVALLSDATEREQSVLLLVNDPHRSTNTRWALGQIAGICAGTAKRPAFRVVVATGTHRFEISERRMFEANLLGGLGLKIESVEWHSARNRSRMRRFGDVHLHRQIVLADHIVPIGSVEPHYFAGITGAHKTLTVGCMATEDIERNHAGALSPASDVMQREGNPVYDGLAQIVRDLQQAGKSICAINEVLLGRQVVRVGVGDPLATAEALVPAAGELYVHEISRPVDVLILDVPMPLGRNLYQADKALKNNHRAVRDGGAIVLRAECPEGIGPDHFYQLLKSAMRYQSAVDIVQRRGYRLGDHKAVKLRHLTDVRRVKITLICRSITDRKASIAGMHRFDRTEIALAWIASMPGPWRTGLKIEDAGMVTVGLGS